MKRILLAGATLLALTTAQPTLAADAPVYKGPAPVAAALFNWSGFYVGIQGGYAWGRSAHEQAGFQIDPFTINGAAVGGTIGWNWQAPGSALVLGVEADISWANITGSFQGISNGFNCGPAPAPCRTDVNWFGTVRGRIGAAFDRSLLYVTGGLAYGGLHADITPSVPAGLFTGGTTKAGWTIGAGWEWAFAPNMSAKIEYLYVDFGRFVYGTSVPNPTATVIFSEIRGGLNWRF